jgi:hypothetical protein
VTIVAISTPPREIVTAVLATGRLASFTTVPNRPVDEAFAGAVPKAKTATIRSERRRPQVFIPKAYGQYLTSPGRYSSRAGIYLTPLTPMALEASPKTITNQPPWRYKKYLAN